MYSLKEYLDLAEQTIKRSKIRALLTDENIGDVANYGMVKNSQFDESRGTSRTSFIQMMMKYKVMKVCEAYKRTGFRYKSNTDEYFDNLNSTKSHVSEVENKDLLNRLEEYLGERDFGILSKYYVQNMTLQEIGNELGSSRENARQLLENRIKKSREFLSQ